MDRDEAIAAIRKALTRRSGNKWSVRGGRGTAWGWITIESRPSRQVDGQMTDEDCRELGELLGLGKPSHHQGESIPSSNAHYREYVDRAEGRTPIVVGQQYWD